MKGDEGCPLEIDRGLHLALSGRQAVSIPLHLPKKREGAALFLSGVLWAAVLPSVGFCQDVVPPPEPLPQSLTLEEALERFRKKGFDLLIADAMVQSAEGDLRIASGIFNPSASGSFGKSIECPGGTSGCRFFGPPLFTASIGDSNALEDWLTGKRGLRKSVAGAALNAARSSRMDAERTLITIVKQQFLQAELATRTLRLARETRDTSTNFLSLTKSRYDLGAISQADLARVQTATLESEQAVDSALQALRQAKVGLAFLLGVRGPVPDFEVSGEQLLHYSVPLQFAEASATSLLTIAMENRTDLRAARAQVSRAENSVALAKRMRFPDIGLSLGYSVQGTDPQSLQVTPPTVTIGLTTTLPIFYQQQGEIQKANADLRAQRLLVAKLEAQVVADVEAAWAAFKGWEALVKRMEQGGLLEWAKRAQDLVFIQYQKGAASLLEYLDARRTYIATNLEYQQDLAGYWTWVFQLQQAIGPERPKQ